MRNPEKHFLTNAFVNQNRTSFDSAELFANHFNNQVINTPFGESILDEDLKAVAKTIAAADDFGLKRQVFFVTLGGFDNHTDLLNLHESRLAELDKSLKSFWDAIKELRKENEVTTFTASDFGRSLRSNGQGSDHAWGGNAVVMGGAVKQRLIEDGVNSGSRIYGNYPTDSEFQLNSGLDVGTNGRMMPTTSIDEYFAELALWFGLPSHQLADVLPGIGNFYSSSSSENPIGFLPKLG